MKSQLQCFSNSTCRLSYWLAPGILNIRRNTSVRLSCVGRELWTEHVWPCPVGLAAWEADSKRLSQTERTAEAGPLRGEELVVSVMGEPALSGVQDCKAPCGAFVAWGLVLPRWGVCVGRKEWDRCSGGGARQSGRDLAGWREDGPQLRLEREGRAGIWSSRGSLSHTGNQGSRRGDTCRIWVSARSVPCAQLSSPPPLPLQNAALWVPLGRRAARAKCSDVLSSARCTQPAL